MDFIFNFIEQIKVTYYFNSIMNNIYLISKQKKFILHLIVSIIGILIFYTAFFYYTKLYLEMIYCMIFILVISYSLFIISNFNFDLKSTLRAGLISFSLLQYPMVLLLWSYNSYLWYIPILIITYRTYNYKVFACICLLLIIVILTTPFVSEFSRLNLNVKLTEKAGLFLKLSPLIFIIPQSLMIIYYFNSFSKLENQTVPLIESNNHLSNDQEDKEEISTDENFYENEKYNLLYEEIIEYFEKSKPYKSLDFNIQSLAKALQTNTSYISRAINLKNEKGFKGLLNYYRIEQVKKDFLNNHQKRYTIKHIYTDAGFSHQASFNRIFKELEGMTPNEFIKDIKRRNRL